jgi:hypothetical protein
MANDREDSGYALPRVAVGKKEVDKLSVANDGADVKVALPDALTALGARQPTFSNSNGKVTPWRLAQRRTDAGLTAPNGSISVAVTVLALLTCTACGMADSLGVRQVPEPSMYWG